MLRVITAYSMLWKDVAIICMPELCGSGFLHLQTDSVHPSADTQTCMDVQYRHVYDRVQLHPPIGKISGIGPLTWWHARRTCTPV